MSKKKLICVLGGVVILIMTAFVELSLGEDETSVSMSNVEALAQQEVDIFKLCPAAGGHCMLSVEQNILGISIDHNL